MTQKERNKRKWLENEDEIMKNEINDKNNDNIMILR